jgi:hypothetical protein
MNPELYWALRGNGGGLFVIVTEFKIRLVKSPPLVQYLWMSLEIRNING